MGDVSFDFGVFGDFCSVCCEEEERFGSIEDLL